MLDTQIASDDESSESARVSGGWIVMMPIMSASSTIVLAPYVTAKNVIVARSMRSHRAFAVVSATAAIAPRTAAAAIRGNHTGNAWTWWGSTARRPNTTSIESAGASAARHGWLGPARSCTPRAANGLRAHVRGATFVRTPGGANARMASEVDFTCDRQFHSSP